MQTINPELYDKPIFQMTGGELLELFGALAESKTVKEPAPKRYVYGLAGIAEIFNCSITKAQEIKNSGKINAAIYQTGKKIVVDADKALELLQKSI